MTRVIRTAPGRGLLAATKSLRGGLFAAAVATCLIVGVDALPAEAATVTATGHAVDLSLLGSSALDTGSVSASPDDPNPSTSEANPLLGVLSAGVLAQAATFDPTTGDSAACAGVVGTGGAIQVGADGTCTASGATGGVTVTLGTNVINAQAILESCSVTANGPSATLSLLGATLNGTALTNDQLAANGTILNLGAIGSITDNTQATAGGVITATALSANLLSLTGSPSVALNIGKVTCGPFTPLADTSVFPTRSLPIAAATLVVLLAIGVPLYRRRHAAHADQR